MSPNTPFIPEQSLILKNIIFKRNDFTINIPSFSLPLGVTALVGSSGCGKTTILRLIAGLERPNSGSIAIDKKIVTDIEKNIFIPAQKRNIGYVFQTPRLLAHLNVMANIALKPSHSNAQKQHQEEIIERLGITRLLNKATGGLSGGEAQRVALARALITKPRILLMDEPLSAIDPKGKDELLEFFAQILPKLKVPIIYVTHSLEEAGRLAKDFAMMSDGKIINTGDAPSVLSHRHGERGDGIASVLSGKIIKKENDGLVTIAIGKQEVQIFGQDLEIGSNVSLHLWARDIILAKKTPKDISARNSLSGIISEIIELQNGLVEVRVMIESEPDNLVSAIVMARTIKEMQLISARPITLLFKSAAVQKINDIGNLLL